MAAPHRTGQAVPSRTLALLGAVVAALTLVAVGCGSDDVDNASGDDVERGPEPTSQPAGGADGEDGSPTSQLGGGSAAVALESVDEADTGSAPAGLVVPDAPEGYVRWVHDQEPAHLHIDELGTPITEWIRQGLVEGLFGVDSSVGYYPELLAEEPTVRPDDDDGGPVTIDYRLRSGLQWSDGESLTSADVAYTYEILTEGCRREADGSLVDADDSGCTYHAESRVGYDRITSFDVTSETGFSITFAGFYPGWRDLFAQVFAAHAYGDSGDEVNENLRGFRRGATALPSSGPLVLEEWEQGTRVLLARNENYHGSVSPEAENSGVADVGGVQLSFAATPDAQVALFAGGEVDLMMLGARSELTALADLPFGSVTSTPGSDYEHLGMNLLNPHLARPEVREAVALAISKADVLEQAFGSVFGSAAPADVLGNAYFVPSQSAYADHQAQLGLGQAAEARAKLEEAGYERSGDGYRHPDDGTLSLRLTTTSHDSLRVGVQDVVAGALEAAGFSITVDNGSAGSFYTTQVFSGEAIEASGSDGRNGDGDRWDLALFGWSSGPWPGGQSGAFRSGSAFNPYGYASPDFDAKANECDTTAADDDRLACYGELDTFVTTLDQGEDGLFVVPLAQRPRLVIHHADRLSSMAAVPDVAHGGPLVNVGDYSLVGEE